MPGSGSGTGTPIALPTGTVVAAPPASLPALSLARYAKRIGYREEAFFGIAHDDNLAYACRQIWTKGQRDMVAWALREAQDDLEAELRYPLSPTWIEGERHNYKLGRGRVCRVKLAWGKVLSIGTLSDTELQAGAVVNYAADPATVGPIALGDCDAGDVHLFHADTNEEITPSSYTEAAGAVTFSIPWARLVDPDYQDNPEEGLVYADVATWGAATVDVRCRTTDTTEPGSLIGRDCDGCEEEVEDPTCIYLRNPELGFVEVRKSGLCYTSSCPPEWVAVNYCAGLEVLPRLAEDMLIRLAHARMPEEPCGCDITQRLWKRDRYVPEVLTRERVNCPWGQSDGAWQAWRWAQTAKLVRGGLFA